MKFLKTIAAALVVALTVSVAIAQYQQIQPNVIGPLGAYGFVCSNGNSAGFPAVGGTGCAQNVDQTPIFTLSGGTGSCATTGTLKGGGSHGSFVCTGTAGAGTVVVTIAGASGQTAPNGWVCGGNDVTQGTAVTQSASTTTTATLKLTTVVNTDTINFDCTGF